LIECYYERAEVRTPSGYQMTPQRQSLIRSPAGARGSTTSLPGLIRG